MHGKSTATAILGWPNDLVTLPDFHRLPYIPDCSEEESLGRLREALAQGAVSAVFLEPLLGSRGGYMASREFVEQVSSLCSEYGSLLVIDEILTGFHRTGPVFLHREFGITPDIVLIGKAMGNGFPVSGVVVDRRHPIDSGSLPGSTYSGNPLGACVVVATLQAIRASEVPKKVADIEQTIISELGGLGDTGVALRGKGALWVLELPPSMNVPELVVRALERGVIVSPTATFVRLLPAATITSAHLTEACGVIRDACQALASG
jgi:acetylornithine/succinyldiaminopimelate/putrescine aminotransferase